MKAKDLQIGDWVKITEPDDFHGYTGEVDIINGVTGYITVAIPLMHSTDVLCDDLEPIPLTKEILKKNGYEGTKDQYSDNVYYYLGTNEYNFKVYWSSNEKCIIITDEEEPGVWAYFCKCEYVHQLQHILALLDKFKTTELDE